MPSAKNEISSFTSKNNLLQNLKQVIIVLKISISERSISNNNNNNNNNDNNYLYSTYPVQF